jgi:hypothetical protein
LKFYLTILLFLTFGVCRALPPTTYYNTISNGDWSTNGVWDTGTSPSTNQTGGNDDITIDHNITLTGTLNVKAGTVITINAGDTLTINGDVEFNNGCTFIVNGVLIINGNVTNNNNSDGVSVNGTMSIDGDYDGGNGSDLGGTGDMDITGSVTTDGDATVFGSTTDCVIDCDNSDENPLGSDPLPVELVWFKGEVIDNHIELSWLVASETNNDYYEIIRVFEDGSNVTIGKVDGIGNTSNFRYYNFRTDNFNEGVNYYKLRQVDFDGEYEEFKIISIVTNIKKEKNILVWPNPNFGDDINISIRGFKGQEVLLVLLDVHGRVHFEKVILSLKDNTIIVVESTLPAGTYMIVGSEKNELYRRKLIIIE